MMAKDFMAVEARGEKKKARRGRPGNGGLKAGALSALFVFFHFPFSIFGGERGPGAGRAMEAAAFRPFSFSTQGPARAARLSLSL